MRYHLFQKVFGKMVKVKETSFLLSKCLVSIAHHCIFLGTCRIILSSSMYVYSQELLRVLAPSFENNGQVDNEVWKSAEQPKGGSKAAAGKARLG